MKLLPLAAILLLWACADSDAAPGSAAEEAAGAETAAPEPGELPSRANPFGFAVWHDDFPFDVYLSPPMSGQWYGFTRAQALRRVVGKLKGDCTREGWLAAKDLFSRAGPEAIPVLIEALDRAMQSHLLADVVENIVEAMGRMGRHHSHEIAEALLRALEHPKDSVRIKAVLALVPAGDADTVRRAGKLLDGLPPRAQREWLRAVRTHLPDAEDVLASFLDDEHRAALFSPAVEECLQLPPERAAKALGPLWDGARKELRLAIAAVLHATGDLRGTDYLRTVLREGPEGFLVQAVGAALAHHTDKLLDDVLALSMHQNPAVRQLVATGIAEMPGENITNLLTTLAADPVSSVRQTALAGLSARGARGHLDLLIEEVRTATGTRLAAALADLSAAADPAAVQAFAERLEVTPPHERSPLIQVIGRSDTPASFDVLARVFRAPEYSVDPRGELTNVSYAGTLFPNLASSGERLLALFDELPGEDYRRRAWLMRALSNLVAFRDGEDVLAAKVYARWRTMLLDRAEKPQLRLLALEYLRRDLTLDDMQQISKLQEAEADDEPMRQALTAFLFEFF